MGFLKSFFTNEKTPEEKALLAAQAKTRDVITLDSYAMSEEEEEQPSGCGGGCGGCGCR